METWSPALSPEESTQSFGSETVNVDAPVFCTRRTSVFMVLSVLTNVLMCLLYIQNLLEI